MHELDRRLQELVSQVQSYPKTDLRRRRIIQDLWDTMLPSFIRGRQPKPTDEEAKRRLADIKKWCREKYSAKLEGDFNQDWSDVLAEVQQEVLIKIDVFKQGVDYQLFKEWQEFNQRLQQEKLPEVYANFQNEVEKFRRRFEQRRTRKEAENYPPEKAQQLNQACQNFCDRIQSSEVNLQQSWQSFCDEVQQLYRPLKFWNWFAYYIKKRFIDIILKGVNEVSGDATSQEEDDQIQTLFDRQQAKAFEQKQVKQKSILSLDIIKIIYEDPDGIFRGKPVENLPKVNFREIALLKFKGATLREIDRHFGFKNAQKTIIPFYTRACHYFEPIINEYLEAELALPETVLTAIINDEAGKFQKRKMPNYRHINFQQIILRRVNGVRSWKLLARELQVNVKDLIEFYLDSVRYFKLNPQTKTRTRRSKNDISQ